MKKFESVVYETIDGQRFTSEQKAIDHEAKLGGITAFIVNYRPDLNETGNLTEKGVIFVHASNSQQLFAEWYCFQRFGNRIAFVQSTFGANAICENWSVRMAGPNDELGELKVLAKIEDKFNIRLWENSITNQKDVIPLQASLREELRGR